MKTRYKCSTRILLSLALANWSLCFESPSKGAEQTPTDMAARIRVLAAEDLGLQPAEQAGHFSQSTFEEALRAKLMVLSNSKVTSLTNGSFTESRQVLSLQATESQLLDFLGNLAASNSALRVQPLALRPTPDHSRLRADVAIVANYRRPAPGPSPESDAAQTEYRVLAERRHLRQAALDCYDLTKSILPPAWQLDSLHFQDGKHLSIQGVAPADQVRLLEDVRTKLEKAQGQDGKDLFVPSSGQATMRMAEPGLTDFSWSMQFDLRPLEFL
jgi:hypothetical protein